MQDNKALEQLTSQEATPWTVADKMADHVISGVSGFLVFVAVVGLLAFKIWKKKKDG